MRRRRESTGLGDLVRVLVRRAPAGLPGRAGADAGLRRRAAAPP